MQVAGDGRARDNPKPVLWRLLSPIAFFLVPVLQALMSRPSRQNVKRWLYKCFFDPYTNVSSRTVTSQTIHEFSLTGTLAGVVQRSVFHYGIFEPNLTSWIVSTLKEGDTFIDVGANVGYFSLLASRLVGNRGHVVALEPSPSNFAALQRNLEKNAAMNVRTVQAAAYDKEAVLPIYSIPEEEFTSGASLVQRVGPREADVPAAPLPRLLTFEELQAARIIKIDVEGTEIEVVHGLLSALRGASAELELVIEVVPKNLQPIIDLMLPLGFHLYLLENPMSPLDLSMSGSGRPVRLEDSARAEAEINDGSPVGYVVFSRRDREML